MRGHRPGQSVAYLASHFPPVGAEGDMMLDSAEYLTEILSKLKYHPKLPEIGANF